MTCVRKNKKFQQAVSLKAYYRNFVELMQTLFKPLSWSVCASLTLNLKGYTVNPS